MAVKRLQNRVTQSRLALPIVSIYGLILWIAGDLFTKSLWINFVCFVISAYLIVELNNTNSLIRTYSRSVSCSFIILTTAASFLFTSMQGSILQLCIIAFYLLYFHSYQNKNSMAWIFYAFFCISLGSMVFVQILFFVPAVWILTIINMRAMSMRTFLASIFGLMAPYWFALAYLAIIGDITPIVTHFADLAKFQPLSLDNKLLSEHQIVTLAFVLILAVTGIIHYLRTSYNDKIRVRMLFEIFIVIDLLTIIFMVLQPQHYDILLRLLIINTSPLIAHYVTLTHTWMTNLSFILILVAALLLSAYNLWIPSLIF